MISTTLILIVLILGFVGLFAFLLYAINDIDSWNKKRTLAVMLHVNICMAALEKRMASGELRDASEIDEAIRRYTQQLHDQGF